ncbi:SGNH/GDSL hydrolase family protein [Rhodohalobacter sp. 614A]|uniref:SGNH/GDSL hydrolase family protein n=1 Tax=Rhodohalobacter sp. 614A TaxID=2908649 RepID=UPI001F1EF20E|nr:hypothetical protein [Rhodohalobacter sp. 614A]
MKTRAGKILLVLAGIILAFILAEILVRVFLPQNKMVTWIEMHPRGFMMNQSDIEALHEFDDRTLRYQFNEWGLRGNKKIQQDDINILLLGDSFTFGLLLNQQATYASLLQDRLHANFPSADFQILNGGIGGTGLADWPGWLNQKGESISPDIIILYLNYMDVDRALSKNLYVVEDSKLQNSIRWKPRKIFMSLGRMGWYRWLQEHSELTNILVKLAWRDLYFSDQTDNFSQQNSQVLIPPADAFDPKSGYSLQLAKLLTEQLQIWCEQNGCRFILTTTGFFDENSTGAHTFSYYKSLVNETPENIYFFDNTPCVHEQTQGDFDNIRIPGDSHPNERGAQIIADCSWNWLQPFMEKEVISHEN